MADMAVLLLQDTLFDMVGGPDLQLVASKWLVPFKTGLSTHQLPWCQACMSPELSRAALLVALTGGAAPLGPPGRGDAGRASAQADVPR
jgi:hypothetical protein